MNFLLSFKCRSCSTSSWVRVWQFQNLNVFKWNHLQWDCPHMECTKLATKLDCLAKCHEFAKMEKVIFIRKKKEVRKSQRTWSAAHSCIHSILNIFNIATCEIPLWQYESVRTHWWTYREWSLESAAPLSYNTLYSEFQLVV